MILRFASISTVTTTMVAAVIGATSPYSPKLANACGGCFVPQDQITRVESHRMIIRLGLESATLWDQIIYSGNPEDFVWVLPVPNENVTIHVAAPEFFDYIEDGTRPAVRPANPLLGCFGGDDGSSGFGCGSSSFQGASASDDAVEDSVEIFDQRTVGPYETVTIASEDPVALTNWLNDNGYNVTDESRPAINYYVEQGAAFVVLRLAPGLETNAMQPVRIDFQGFMGQFPLKMVAVGARGILDLSLWIIADQRYEVANYGTVEIDENDITWDWATSRSNYQDVFNQTAEASGNRAWIAEYANPLVNLESRGLMRSPPEEALEDIQIARHIDSDATSFITRLRTRILVDHINEDLQLSPAVNPDPIEGLLFAAKDLNRPADSDCGESTDDGSACQAGSSHRATAPMLLLLAALVLIRRRRKLPSFITRR